MIRTALALVALLTLATPALAQNHVTPPGELGSDAPVAPRASKGDAIHLALTGDFGAPTRGAVKVVIRPDGTVVGRFASIAGMPSDRSDGTILGKIAPEELSALRGKIMSARIKHTVKKVLGVFGIRPWRSKAEADLDFGLRVGSYAVGGELEELMEWKPVVAMVAGFAHRLDAEAIARSPDGSLPAPRGSDSPRSTGMAGALTRSAR